MTADPAANTDAGGFHPGVGMRPIDRETYFRIARVPWILFLLAGLSAGPILLSDTARAYVRHPVLAAVGGAATVLLGLVIFVFVELVPALTARAPSATAAVSIGVAGGVTTLALVAFGPRFGVIVIVYPEPVIFAFILFTLRWALGFVVAVGIEAGLVFALQDGWFGSPAQWIFVLSSTVGLSVVAGQLTARLIASTAAERAARAELAEVNDGLEQRVNEQLGDLERAGRLKRFLAPQVADTVLSGDHDDLLAAHRRRIAVFFCDLRGFTAFAAQSEPEDVMDVLGAYYRVVGERLRAHNATVGSFAGDGIMAYLNDPVPCADPAATAVTMAAEVRAALGDEVRQWRRRGYDLGFGIGIAVGHATLGVVGYEGREDYTALGTVVNLAARLCAAANAGQILIDPQTAGDLETSVRTETVDGIALKGFPAEMEIRSVSEGSRS